MKTYLAQKNVVGALLLILSLFTLFSTKAQQDTIHYMPPTIGANYGDFNEWNTEVVVISTNSLTPISVIVETPDGNAISGSPFTIVRSNPEEILIGSGQTNHPPLSVTKTDPPEISDNRGLVFRSSDLFSVSYRSSSDNHAAFLSTKGAIAKGREFRWASPPLNKVNEGKLNTYISIMAVENATITITGLPGGTNKIDFTNRNNIDTYNNAGTIIHTLPAGRSLILEINNQSNTTENLEGFIGANISSTGDIVVNTGGQSFKLGGSQSTRDHGLDQLVPVEQLGNEYIVVQGNGSATDERAIVYATQDNTDISINGTYSTTINDGEYAVFNSANWSNGVMLIESSAPVYVHQVVFGSSSWANIGLNFLFPISDFSEFETGEIPNVGLIDGTVFNNTILYVVHRIGATTQATQDGANVSPTSTLSVASSSDYEVLVYNSSVLNPGSEWLVSSTSGVAVSFLGASGVAGYGAYVSQFPARPVVEVLELTTSCNLIPVFELSVNSGPWSQYQWRLNDVDISGATAQTFTPTQSGSYSMVVSDGINTATSQAVNVTITTNSGTDTDGDNIIDTCDQDDDNDGILDTEEGLTLSTSCTSIQTVAGVIQGQSNVNNNTVFNAINDGVATEDVGIRLNDTNEHFVLDLGQVYEPGAIVRLDISGNGTSNREVETSEIPGGLYLSGGGTNILFTDVAILGTDVYFYTLQNPTQYIQIDMTVRIGDRTVWTEATVLIPTDGVIAAESNVDNNSEFGSLTNGSTDILDGYIRMDNTNDYFVLDLGEEYSPGTVLEFNAWGNNNNNRRVETSEIPGGVYISSGGTNVQEQDVSIDGQFIYTYTLANTTRYLQVDMTVEAGGNTRWTFVNLTTACRETGGFTDTDNDGLTDNLDLDSDNDGIPDIIEAGGVDANNDGQVDYPTTGDPLSMVDANNNGWSSVFDDGSADGRATEGGTPLADPNSDGDSLPNRIDLDCDNDGITDNIEGQTTQGYIAPNADDATTYETNRGINSAYLAGFTPVDTDGDLTPDYLDGDSDEDGLTDLVESFTTTPVPANGVGINGLSDDAEASDDYTDVNANAHNGTAWVLLDSDGDMNPDGSNANGFTTDFDYRDAGCFELNLRVFLEGSLIEESTGAFLGTTMRTSLNDGRFLPGQLSENLFFGNIYSTPGQPYNIAPWNYTGLQGAGFDSGNDPANADANYPATVVDWVLVSLRTSDTGSTLFQRAALLLENGDVEFVGEDACFQLEAAQSYFVVVEHKNHLIVMSDAAVSPVDGVLTYDFTTQQSYINDPFFFGLVGQKEISTGVFAMYGGNADQSSTSSADVDITAGDDSIWNLNSPETRTYEVSDFNLDGEINAADRALFIINSPKTSSVPRN